MRFGLRSGVLAAALAFAWSGAAGAADIFIDGKITIIKNTKLFKLVAKDAGGVDFAIPAVGGAADPLANPGTSSVEVLDTGNIGNLTDNLAGGTWSGLGNPPGTTGYKYKNTAAPTGGAVKIIILKPKVIKILAKDDGTLNGPVSGNVGIILTTGADRYCAEFGGTTIKNVTDLVKRKDAPAPGACPVQGAACCNGDSFINFTSGSTPGDCGDIVDAMGVLITNVQCAGLYTGGGGNSVPLPYALPDQSTAISKIASCAADVATIDAMDPATSADTGSLKNCTAAGCFFGAPLPVPNPGSTPTSVCVVNKLSSNVSGTVNCATGATDIDAPLSSILFLTGDTATDPGATIPGIQPCPLCQSGSCIGGPNNGMTCVAGTSALNPSFPTSNDCPPDNTFNIGTLPIAFSLTSGALTWSGTTATNDTGGTVSTQNRVFSGFCRDADGTGAFEGTNPSNAKLCWENGAAVGTACSGTFESCEQRNNGAFGPSGGNNRTVTAIGNAMSITGGPAAATLVSIFSIRPTFDPTVDAAGDLPGPGLVALPGVAQTCAAANPCP